MKQGISKGDSQKAQLQRRENDFQEGVSSSHNRVERRTNLYDCLITLIHSLFRFLRPERRERSITSKTKEVTKDKYIEREITIKDKY